MSRRSYDQFCGLAYALDAIGERWTLLIVRELMTGPRRYSDLAASLDGIGTSLLATRVRQLEADGVVRRRLLDPPAASVVYDLTTAGRELARATMPLAIWGARHLMHERASGEDFRAEWALVFLADSLDATTLGTLVAEYDFEIDGSTVRLSIADGHAQIGPATDTVAADAVLTSDAATVAAVAGGRVSLADALARGRVEANGNPAALQSLLEVLDAALKAFAGPV
jgi:DNA-binding HxlR family transcriptional regulator